MTDQKFFPSTDFLALLRPTKASDTLSPQLCTGLDVLRLGECLGLGLLKDRTTPTSTLSYRDEVLELVQEHSLAPTSLETTLSRSFDQDALLQPGIAILKLATTSSDAIYCRLKNRVSGAHFTKSPEVSALVEKFEKASGFAPSLHYVQNFIGIDIDFKDQSDKKIAFSQVQGRIVKGTTHSFLQHISSALGGLPPTVRQHLYALWFTQNGMRLVFTHEPIETASTSDLPMHTSIPSSTDLKKVYLGLSKGIIGTHLVDVTLDDGTVVHLEMDTDSTKSSFALSRLAKVKKRSASGIVSLRQTKVLFFDQAVPMMISGELFQQALALGQSLSLKAAVSGGDVETTFQVPLNFSSDADKIDFAENLLNGLASHPMLMLYSRSPVMPYEGWRQILTSFRRVRQVLDRMGCSSQSQKVLSMAHEWSKASAGYSTDAHYLVDGMLADSHEATFAWQSVNLAMGPRYQAWVFSTPEAKKLHDAGEMDASHSLFSSVWSQTCQKFKGKAGYSPFTGRNPVPKQLPLSGSVLCGTPFLDSEGKAIQWSTLTVDLAQKILRTDPLLPTILQYNVIAGLKVVTPNFGDIIADALDGKFLAPIDDVLVWRPIDDGATSMLRVYLKRIYQIKSEPSKDQLQNLYDLIEDTSSSKLEKFQFNPLFDAAKARYMDFCDFRKGGKVLHGLTADEILDSWLPMMLRVDPSKSLSHQKFYKRASAIGRKLAIGLVQRACSLDATSIFEQIFIIKSKSQGGGKTQLAKSLVSSFLRSFTSKDVSSFGGMAGIEEFCAETKGSIPEDKDEVARTFGKVVSLLDDFDKKFLTTSGGGDLKRYLSQTRDVVRKPYAKFDTMMNRTFVTVATTNLDRVLSDDSGSRRFWILDLDSVSEDGRYICDLLDRSTLTPTEREVSDGNGGYIDMTRASLLSLAYGAAFEVGVLGENLKAGMCMDGTVIAVPDKIQSHYKLDMTSKLGKHTLTERVDVERPYLHHRDVVAMEEYNQVTFSLATLGVEDHKKVMMEFLEMSEAMGGLGQRIEFELSDMKNFIRGQSGSPASVSMPSDQAVKLWASQGIVGKDGRLYKIVSRRVESKGLRRTLWVVVDEAGQKARSNPWASVSDRQPLLPSKHPIEISVTRVQSVMSKAGHL